MKKRAETTYFATTMMEQVFPILSAFSKVCALSGSNPIVSGLIEHAKDGTLRLELTATLNLPKQSRSKR